MEKLEKVQPLEVEGYQRDEDLVRSGAPVSIGINPDGSHRIIIVRPLNSHAYERALEARQKNYSPATLKANPELARSLQKEAAADTAFVGFENHYPPDSFVEEPPGSGAWKLREGVEPIENTRENRRRLLEGRDFFLDFVEAAGSKETFRKARAEEVLGNAPRSSSGG